MQSTESLWLTTSAGPAFPVLETDHLHVDVIVVGAGVTGITTALLLKEAGQRVCLVDAHRVAGGVSAVTTAHLTEAVDTRYHELERKFGGDGARLVAQSSREAIELIVRMAAAYGIDCGIERVPGYLYTQRKEQVAELEHEAEACVRAGLSVSPSDVPMPVAAYYALRFEAQAQVHLRAYLLALAQRIPGDGSHVFEGARVCTVDEGEPCRVHTDSGLELTADRVVLATHAPLNRVLLQTKIAHYRSYVVCGKMHNAPRGLYWDTEEPYHYVRSQLIGQERYLIVGGEDHKTGQESDTTQPFARLERYARSWGLQQTTHRWSGQVVESVDGLPFIGRNAGNERVYVATGYSGNGVTFGTVAGMMLADACMGRASPYAELYAATRVKPVASLRSYLEENVDFPLHVLGDALRPPDVASPEQIARGEGKIVRVRGQRLAVYRDDLGALHAVSPICTHLGCHVRFNAAERTWDCPCHGSRFMPDGSVVNGPAVRALKKRPL